MKREDLKKIEGLTAEQIDSIMDLHQSDVTDWNSRLDTQKAEIQKRDDTISELTTTVKKYDGVDVEKLQDEIKGWEEKYQQGLAEKDKEYAKRLLFDSIPFASNLAKEAAVAQFDAKELEFKDGKFLGADDFISLLKESDPNAFKQEEAKKVQSTGLAQGKALDSEELSGVEKKFFELNPNLKK